jgi:hypothetical protein
MGAKTKQVGGGTATGTANNWNQFLNQQLQGGMAQGMSNAQQPGMQQQGFQQALGGALGGRGPSDVSGAGGLLQKYFQGGGGGGMTDLSTFGIAQSAAPNLVTGTGMAKLDNFGTASQASGTGMANLGDFFNRDPRTGFATGVRSAQSNFNTQAPVTSGFDDMLMSMIQKGGPQGQSGFSAASAGPEVQMTPQMSYQQAYGTLGEDPLMQRQAALARADQRARFGAEGAGALGTGAQFAESNLNAELAARDASMRRQQAMQLMGQDLAGQQALANVGLQNRGQNVQTAIANMQGGLQGAQNMNQFNLANQSNMLGAMGQARGQDLNTALQQLQLGAQQGQFNAGQQNAMQQALMNAQLQNQQMGNQQGQFNAGQQNQMQQAMMNAMLQNQQLGNQFGQFNVGQANQMNQFNAGQANQMQQAMLQAQLQNQQMGNQFGLGMLGQGMNMNQLAAQQQQNAMNQMFGAFQQANQLGTPQAQMIQQPSMWGQLANAALGLGSAYLTGGGSLGGLFGGGQPSLPAPSASMFMPGMTPGQMGGFTPSIPMPTLGAPLGAQNGTPFGNPFSMPTFMLPPGR